jgi:glycosyltransferase involved in cell wall biosynthesis
MNRILFITKSSGGTASARVRIKNLCPGLEAVGLSTQIVRFPKSLRDKWLMLKLCMQFDVIFLQKVTPPLFYARLLRLVSKKLIYDFDDAFYYKANKPSKSKDWRRVILFKNIIKKADLVIAGNRLLAEEVKRHTPHCEVLPSAVETRNIPVKDYNDLNSKFVIGWVGNKSNLTCLAQLSQVLEALAKRHAIQVRVISSETIELPGVDTQFIPWDERTQEREIAKFDVGIMPLRDYPHSRGKCAYKALQYMAAGVPPVVSDVGINSQVVENGVCGFVARELRDFETAIETLIKDRSLIRQMGEAAKVKVSEQFSIERVGEDLAKILN